MAATFRVIGSFTIGNSPAGVMMSAEEATAPLSAPAAVVAAAAYAVVSFGASEFVPPHPVSTDIAITADIAAAVILDFFIDPSFRPFRAILLYIIFAFFVNC